MDKDTRNLIRQATQDARDLLEREFTEQLEGTYDILRSGKMASEPGAHLDARERIVREKLVAAVQHHQAQGMPASEAVQVYLREACFTFLNRFVALKMLEARQLVQECVSRGEISAGFREFTGLAPGLTALPDHGYRLYIESLFDEVGREVRVLFDRSDPASLLWPRRAALRELLVILNRDTLAGVWGEDETIGWVYQYFNRDDERREMRDKSPAPRNSRELAVRNQFFTPRYVVQFLTDNTLARTWYEMRQGDTRLAEQCEYLVRRPNEVFLAEGESAPEAEPSEDLSQEELLRQPVYIPFRTKKDPRDLKILDPACGSGHFLLYCFDLLLTIYEEAWAEDDDELTTETQRHGEGETESSLRQDYRTQNELRRALPGLILEHNLHGIDIDARCAQIAALSLWMRAQRAFNDFGISRAARPPIGKTNIVVAEPMPGDRRMLEEFLDGADARLRPLVREVVKQMELAGEAGSLLKIEEALSEAIERARFADFAPRAVQVTLLDEAREAAMQHTFEYASAEEFEFWDRAERQVVRALEAYAGRAAGADGTRRRLFAHDAAQGFAFIHLCRERYDVVLMNPPFGDASLPSKPYLDETYADTKGDVYKAFVECFHGRLIPAGYVGIISSRTGFFLSGGEDWRTRVVLRLFRPIVLADLGSGVLDAMVEVAAYVLRSLSVSEARDLTLSLVPVLEKLARDRQDRFSLPKWQAARNGLKRHQAVAELEHLQAGGFVQRCHGNIVRFTILREAITAVNLPPETVFPPLVCIRALAMVDKGSLLADTIRTQVNAASFICNPTEFLAVSGAPFSYWASPRIRALFSRLPQFETDERFVRQGLATSDDFRFVRLSTEVPKDNLNEGQWRPFAKGGAYSPFYADMPLVVVWGSKQPELEAFGEIKGNAARSRQSSAYYFRPGLTWPLRARAFSPQVMAAGCIFSVRGYAMLAPSPELAPLLGLTASSVFDYLFKVLLGRFGFPEFVVGVLNKLPTPNLANEVGAALGELAIRAWSEKRAVDTARSTSHAFVVPALLVGAGATLAERSETWAARVRKSEETVAAVQAEIDDLASRLYGLNAADRAELAAAMAAEATGDPASETGEDEEEESASADAAALAADLLAYAVGCALGRWDVRIATGECRAPPDPEPFSPLPVCSPGTLQGKDGLPLTTPPPGYPIDFPAHGILVDDEGQALDLCSRVSEVFRVVFTNEVDARREEATELLDPRGRDLRGWLARSFWDHHIKQYSRSRRRAPIYWQLSIPSVRYSLWLYYHRFTPDTLYTAAELAKRKLQHEEGRLTQLRQDAGPNPTRSQGREIEDQERFVDELRGLHAGIARVAPLWKPDLDDGVIINFAPLWRLVPQHPQWQRECRECWEKLVAGEFDWSHLAMHLWPERVVPKCATDRSLAIAHELEEVFWFEDEDGKWKRLETPLRSMAELLEERSSPAVKAALHDLLSAPEPAGRGRARRR